MAIPTQASNAKTGSWHQWNNSVSRSTKSCARHNSTTVEIHACPACPRMEVLRSARRIAVIDKDGATRASLQEVCRSAAPSWKLAAYRSIESMMEAGKMDRPAVVVLQPRLESELTFDIAARLFAICSAFPVICISEKPDIENIILAVRAGVRGCLIKPVSSGSIISAICAVAKGEIRLCHQAQSLLVNYLRALAGREAWSTSLTYRQREVAECVLKNLQSKQISAALGISIHTVNTHLRAVFRKCHLTSRHQLRRRYFCG